MKRLSILVLLLAFLAVGCAHRTSPVSPLPQLVMVVSNSEQILLKSPEVSVTSGGGSAGDRKNLNEVQKAEGEETVTIAGPSESSKSSPEMSVASGNESADRKENLGNGEKGEEEEIATTPDPLESFNRAMFRFNDKLYFWVLKPVAQGYKKVVPEAPRVGVNNFFSNLKFPIRFVSSLFQADFSGAATEFGRFAVNTIWGVGGLLDPASSKQLNIPKNEADLGQTLGVYGLGQGFYIVWPILGPSSVRDSIGIVGDYFLYPVSYITPWYDWLAVRAYEEVNDTSLKIGDYEFIKEAAIDPYVALRDGYAQYRQKKIENRRGKPEPAKPGRVR
jgi:phospholipid-binding lipoprotein MlaA